ncbi:MAG: hypothetical protein AAB445_02875 [Patescibacteria group bacterium]
MKYLVGIILIGIGFVIVWKAEWLMDNMGRIDWAERHLGSDGGTRAFYKLIGVAIILLSFLLMGGGLGSGLKKVFAPVDTTVTPQEESESL